VTAQFLDDRFKAPVDGFKAAIDGFKTPVHILSQLFKAPVRILSQLLKAPVRILPKRPHLLQEFHKLLPGGKGLEHDPPQLMTHLGVFPQEPWEIPPQLLDKFCISHYARRSSTVLPRIRRIRISYQKPCSDAIWSTRWVSYCRTGTGEPVAVVRRSHRQTQRVSCVFARPHGTLRRGAKKRWQTGVLGV
jgi:hypothetical protein